ncbi:MAG: SDR family oxidoreductase, partial [Betaproteobacteria bacterium]
MRLENKVAIVTGAGSGFGRGIAQRFAAEGAKVIVNDVNADNGEHTVADIVLAGGDARFFVGDVTRDADVRRLVEFALASFGGLDIVVNNAGTTHKNQPMLDVSEEQFDRIYQVNVKSLYLTAKHAVPHMRARHNGVFITIASTAGVRPRPGLTWYNGSKGA